MQPMGAFLPLLAVVWAAPELARVRRDGSTLIEGDIMKDLQAAKDAKKAGTL